MPYSEVDDSVLFEKIQKADFAERIKTQDEWKLFDEMCKRVIDNAVDEFAIKTDPTDIAKIVKLQTIIKLYKHMFLNELNQLITEGRLVFDEIKDRGELESIL